jgi:glutamyl-tRNA synthetase
MEGSRRHAGTLTILRATREELANSPDWSASTLEGSLREMAEKLGTTAGKVFQPLRVALTGVAASPGIFDVLEVLGRERSIARLDAAIRYTAESV